jgi:lysine 2,3-aminomutase
MSDGDISEVVEKFPLVAGEYARKLAEKSHAFRLQVEPSVYELEDDGFDEDPFGEMEESALCFGLKQRFEDRVLIMASNACFMNCRHCTRKGLLKHAEVVRSDEELSDCVTYVLEHPAVRDVLISGGDPLVLPDGEVMRFVEAFSNLEQVDVVRLCTRAPCVNPSRITDSLAKLLGDNGKVWVNTQFNCADEVTPEAAQACLKLVKAGVPVSCQTVLLAGVNDSVEAMLNLFKALQRIKVRPYYVFQCDPVAGISHFRVPLERAKEIERECAERIGGLGMPRFVIDLPGSKKKTPISEYDD